MPSPHAAPRICIDARLVGGMSGGVEQAIVGLASGLAGLTDGEEEYFFLTFRDHDEWLRPFIGGRCKLLPSSENSVNWKARWSQRLPGVHRAYRRVNDWIAPRPVPLPVSDGTVERAGADVVHFAVQQGFTTSIPSMYQPHDLQHLHLPELFTKRDMLTRESHYRHFCSMASTIVVSSEWVKQDVVNSYGIHADKIAVIPPGAPLAAYGMPGTADRESTKSKFGLPDHFVYFPAQTWPHKNHLNLLEALAILRDRDNLIVPLVCSGRTNEFHAKILRRIEALGLGGQVHFLGFIAPAQVYCLYTSCRCVVFPSKFEGFGFPVCEALFAGAPLACSQATCLPEVAGGAARYFDPENPGDIAAAVAELWTSEALRDRLVTLGRERIRAFSWDSTARAMRAQYRNLAGRGLDVEDRRWLAIAQGPR